MSASQLWALVAPDGSYMLRWTARPQVNPRRAGCAAELRGRRAHRLSREPVLALGETIAWADGKITFDRAKVLPGLIATVKAEAARRIEAVAPLWRQINDLAEPDAAGAAERRAFVKAVRAYSNQAETALESSSDARTLAITMAAITRGWPAWEVIQP